MDLPVIFSKGWFIYLRKLVLALKHTPPLTELTRKYGMYSKLNLVTLVYPYPIPHPPTPSFQHTHTYMHTLPRVSLVGRDWGDPPTTQQIGLSPHAVFGHFVQNAPPLQKTGVKIIMGV